MGDKANPLITRKVMQEYEKLRKSATVNMYDKNAVYTASAIQGLTELHAIVADDITLNRTRNNSVYLEIIRRYEFYMNKYKMVS